MNEFPLTPFFIILEANGIRVGLDDYDRVLRALQAGGLWNIARLRGTLLALLVQHSDQEATFLRHFDSFFSPTLEVEALTTVQLKLIWKELEGLASGKDAAPSQPPLSERAQHNEESDQIRKHKLHFHPRWPSNQREYFYAVVLALGLISIVALTYRLFRQRDSQPNSTATVSPQSPSLTASTSNPTPAGTNNAATPTPIVPPVPNKSTWYEWRYWTGIVLGFLPLLFGYGIFLLRIGKNESEAPLSWDPDAPRYLPLNKIGGQPAPHLDSAILDELADALSYFQSRQPGKHLDLRASVEAVARHSGLPQLVFRKRKELRRIYVLEDAFAEPLAWNPISQELAEGLRERGVQVTYGRFEGSPAHFKDDNGAVVLIEDLDDNRGDYLVLFFSDGKWLSPRRDAFVLESLAHWPFVAWMELRERAFWDESTAFVAEKNLQIYSASPKGLLQAMQGFLNEQGATREDFVDSSKWRGVPANVGNDLTIYVESLLGDALPWAQACAMIQPVTVGLADALRRTFQPSLPAQRIERLFYLPGTYRSVSGFRFSLPVRAVLRAGFARRWNEFQQQQILNFLLGRIAEIEPAEKNSLSHLSWRLVRASVLLELDPDAALKQFALLEQTPFKAAIRSEFRVMTLPDSPLTEPGSVHPTRIPLRRKPQDKRALEYLAGLSPNILSDRTNQAPLRRFVDSWLPAVEAWWEKRKRRAQLRPAVSLIIAWLLISPLSTPSLALLMVYAILSVALASDRIDGLSDAWNRRPKKAVFRVAVEPAYALRTRSDEIIALALLAGGLLLSMCLISGAIYPNDPSWNSVGQGETHNLVGEVGAKVSAALFQAIGLAAYLVPVFFFVAAWNRSRVRPTRASLSRFVGVLTLVLTAASLLSISNLQPFFDNSVPVGGLAGAIIWRGLTSGLNTAGATILLIAIGATGILLATNFSFIRFYARIRFYVRLIKLLTFVFRR